MLLVFITATGAFLNHRNAHPRGQFANRSWKIEMLVIHHEAKDRPTYAAPETMKCLPLRTNVERRRFFLVKRTERSKIRTSSFQREIGADHLHNVIRGGNLFDCW